MKTIPSARRESEARTSNKDSLISWWGSMVVEVRVHAEAVMRWPAVSVFLRTEFPRSLHDVIREWRPCFGHHGGITLHPENPGTKEGHLIQWLASYITTALKGGDKVSWCSNQDTHDGRTTKTGGNLLGKWAWYILFFDVKWPLKLENTLGIDSIRKIKSADTLLFSILQVTRTRT